MSVKACPKCGSGDSTMKDNIGLFSLQTIFYRVCPKCHFNTDHARSKSQATKNWNKFPREEA